VFDLDAPRTPAGAAPVSLTATFVAKSNEEQFVLGVVLVPEEPDLQDDIVSAAEIRNAAHRFMEWYQAIGLQHERSTSIKVLESFIAPTDLQLGDTLVKAGSWLVGVHVTDPQIWAMVKDGRLRGFSIGGYANRVPVAESEVPADSFA
jgi:DNA adenine methylase